jgi:hypothetical protein
VCQVNIDLKLIFSYSNQSKILLSLFVAVILDNLELEEDVKKIKQLKMREQSAETQETLPWRLRIFEKFPNQPQMVALKRVPNEFSLPKIRESFMRQFLEDEFNLIEEEKAIGGDGTNNQTNQLEPSTQNELNDKSSNSNNRLRASVRKTSKNFSFFCLISKNPLTFFLFNIELSSNVPNLESISENPTSNNSNNNQSLFLTNKKLIDVNDLNNTNLFRRRKLVTSNAHAAQLRIINNIRMQRACRYSMKKLAINNMVDYSNNQRLFNGDGVQMPILIGMNDLKQSEKTSLNLSGAVRARNPLQKNRPSSALVGGLKGSGLGNPLMINANMGPNGGVGGGSDLDFKLFQYKKQQAELKRNQLEEDLKENHPYFDKPLFTIGRESNFRKFCQMIVEARYQRTSVQRDQNTQSTLKKDQYKQFYKFLGLVTYLDWIMIAVTIQSCIGMMFESPSRRLVETLPLQVVEYLFVISMAIEMTLKVCAYGLFFTPKAVVKDFGGILDLFIFSVSAIVLYLSPKEVVANSGAQLLMLLRCLRPLRIFTLVPHMRKVIYELCRGFKEILLVFILLVVLLFIFANFGLQMYGGKLARCNDEKILDKKNCTGLYKRELLVTKLKFPERNAKNPSIWVSRVWSNPYNFNFDSIGNAMLALFEVLSLEGWLEVRDIIIDRMGTVKYFLIFFVLKEVTNEFIF